VSETHQLHTPEQAIERLAGLPGGPELLALAQRREDIALVGGAVRDLLLGRWPRELDVTVERDAAELAAALAASVSPSERAYGHAVEPVLHEHFGTASVAWEYGRIDIAARRAEVYPSPGALPEVRPGTVEEDLARRDFTINAIALPLAGAQRARLLAHEHALEDLAAGRLRVLHERSFADDPTRLLRMARYAARLHFAIESGTRELAERALRESALDTVSGERVGGELWLAVREPDGRASLRAFDSLGVLGALGLPSPFDDDLAEHAEALLPRDGDPGVVRMAAALRFAELEDGVDDGSALQAARRLGFDGAQAEAASAAGQADALAELAASMPAAAAFAVLDGRTLEAVALAGAVAERRAPGGADTFRAWLETQRHVRLEIGGEDLLAAGVREGPEVGARLALALRRKREGAASGREEELRAALEPVAAPGDPIETSPR